MRYTEFGQTGLEVSRLSMGGNRLGEAGVDPAVWPPIVQRALDLGVTFFDTANSYSQGRSEEILGDVTARWPKPTVLATKGGVPGSDNNYSQRTFTAPGLKAAAEQSLARLGRDSIDLYMLHSPTVEQLRNENWREAIDALKSEGTIRYWGISTHDHASGMEGVQQGAQFLQLEYDILNASAEEELLPLAQARNVGVMVRTPLARGLLSGKFRAGQAIPPEQQWRRPKGDVLETRLRRVEQLRFLEREGQTMAQAALRWALEHPAVHCVIPGARTLEQLQSNVDAINGELLPEESARIRELQEQWRGES